MADFPYTIVPARLKSFFPKIQELGAPQKVTRAWLEQAGFKTKADRTIPPVLKFIGFVDSSGVPTAAWKGYQSREAAAKILATSIRQSYGELFEMYPDAHRKDEEALRNFFRPKTSVSPDTLQRIVTTFRILCSLSEFDGESLEIPEAKPLAPRPIPIRQIATTTQGLVINLNIQLQLPATENSDVYDKLFAALHKHLMSQ